MVQRLAVLVLVGWIAVAGEGTRPALAHGGVVTVDGIYAGCHLVVQALPTPDSGQVRLSVMVSAAGSGALIVNALVEVEAVPVGGGAVIALRVPPEPGQPGFYDATVALPTLGDWQFWVRLRRAGMDGTAPFSLTVQGPPDRVSWLIGVMPGMLGLVLVGFLRLRGRSKCQRGTARGAAAFDRASWVANENDNSVSKLQG